MQVWTLKRAARGSLEMQDEKSPQKLPSGHHRCWIISSQLRKKVLSSDMSSRSPDNMVNFGLLAAEIGQVVWGTPPNFNGFRVLAALLHGSQVVGVSQTLRHWTEGTTYVRQGVHHVAHSSYICYLSDGKDLVCAWSFHQTSCSMLRIII